MKRALAGLLLLAGCDAVGAPEEMSFADARANLIRTAGSGSATAFCSDEGRVEFRRAVRTYSAAAQAEHVELGAMQFAESDEATGLIMVGLLARIVKPQDLRGQHAAMAMVMNMPGGGPPGLANARDAMAKACPEMVTAYREMALYMRLQARASRAEELDMSARDRARLSQRMQSQYGRVQRAAERFQDKMRAEGWDGDTSAAGPF